MARLTASWLGPIRFLRLPLRILQIVDAGTPEAADRLACVHPVASKKVLISSDMVFMWIY